MNSGSLPLVTVVIPSFNQGRFIRETIESCLSQDYRPLEILVMDGGSKDETVAVLRSFDAPELHWCSEPDEGVVDAVNKGLAKARGDILSIQSSDDVFLPGAISCAVEALRSQPSADLVYGDVELIDQNSMLLGADEQGEFDYAACLGRFQYIPQPGTFFTRAAMTGTGQWRATVSYVADSDYWLRMASRFPVKKIHRRVARYRYHDEQRDRQRARLAQDWATAMNDLIASAVLTPAQQRHARMGIWLAKHRYAPPGAWLYRTRMLYAALVANPAAVTDSRFPKRDLLPAREPVLSVLSWVKQRLGFKPRTQ
jgi:glycosyltransferase involved in cell wall biosynthesis